MRRLAACGPLLVALALALPACPAPPADRAAPAPSASTSSASSAPSASAAPVTKWYSGTWSGKVTVARQELDVAADAGRLRVWDQDDGAVATGEGALTVTFDAAGIASGRASGPLGELVVTGAVEGDAVRLALVPAAASVAAFTGYVVLNRKGDELEGVLKASSGDSALVRRAAVKLTHQPQ